MKLLSALPLAMAAALAAVSAPGHATTEKSQVQPRFSSRLIVKYKAGPWAQGLSAQQIRAELRRPLSAQKLQELSAAVGRQVNYVRPLATGAHVVTVAGAATPQATRAALAALRARSDVEYVEEDARKVRQGLPNDPLLSGLWSFKPPVHGTIGADFVGAWSLSTGKNVTVAVLDTGILPHPDIVGTPGSLSPATGRLVSPGYTFISDCWMKGTCSIEQFGYAAPTPGALDLGDFVTATEDAETGCGEGPSSWHGTHVAGTVAAIGNNSAGVVGGAYGAGILPVRVLGKCGGYDSDIAEGILWAAGVHPTIPNPHPAQVLNMSLGGGGACSLILQEVIAAAVGKGAVVVVAAGNEDDVARYYSPGNCPGVITVAATGRHGEKAFYSNHDAPGEPAVIALAAPGGSDETFSKAEALILSTLNSGKAGHDPGGWSYEPYQGTSMAAPHVAAAVALMRSHNPNMTPAQVKALLTAPSSLTPFPTATGVGEPCSTSSCGAGILNAERAVKNSTAVLLPSPAEVDYGTGLVNKTDERTVTFTNASPLLPVAVGKVKIGGAAPGAYATVAGADTCANSVMAPGQSCSVGVSLRRPAVGKFEASLELEMLSPQGEVSGAVVVALNGLSSALQPLADTLTVPDPKVGKSAVLNATFRNAGSESAQMGSLLLSRPDIMAVSSDACSNVTLAPGASCTARITVTPRTAGSFSGTLSLKSTAVGDPGTQVTIRGMAGEAPAAAPEAPAALAATGAGGGGGCTALPLGQGDFSLLAYLGAALALGWTRRKRPSRH